MMNLGVFICTIVNFKTLRSFHHNNPYVAVAYCFRLWYPTAFFKGHTVSRNFVAMAMEWQSVEKRISDIASDVTSDHVVKLSKAGRLTEALDALQQFENAEGMWADSTVYNNLLQGCANARAFRTGKKVHARIMKTSTDLDMFTSNNLINMYAKCGSLIDARQVFDKMPGRDVISWNIIISGYAQRGWADEALKLFVLMQKAGMRSNEFTFGSALRASAGLAALQQGEQIHTHIMKTGYQGDVHAGSALLDMYGKCGRIDDSQRAFYELPEPNTVSWNALIAGYSQNGYVEEALEQFNQMQRGGMTPDQSTFASVVTSFASSEAPEQVKQVHAKIMEYGLESDVVVGNALVTVYAKSKQIRDAEMVFETMHAPDLVSWNAMIAGYAYNEYTEQALRFFTQMRQMGMMIDKFTLTSILSACGNPGALEQGKGVHAHAMKIGLESETPVRNALITMYLNSGCVEDATEVFNSMTKRDVVTWNALIAGYAQHGHGEEALKFYCQMQHTSTRQDKFTFSCVLRACASLAALEQGKQVHAQIAQTSFVMDAFVGSAIVYMYGKCGVIEYACKVFDETSKQCAVSWNAMIAVYAQHGHCKKALQLFEQMQEGGMKPDHVTFVSVLSACSHAGLVDEGICYFNSMGCDHGIPPRMEHYACTVDILGRAGHLEEAIEFINKMPFKPDGTVWRTLLGACATYGNIELGIHAAKYLLELEPQEDVAYVLMSNIYAAAGRWDDSAKMRKIMREKGLKKEPGCSWIEIKNTVHTFNAEDRSHPQTEEIYLKLEELMGKMKAAGYVPNTNFVMHDV